VRQFAFRLYILFMFSWFLHLPTRFEALGAVRADLLLVTLIFGLILAGQDDSDQIKMDQRTGKALWVLVVYAFVTIPLVEWPGSVLKIGFPNFFKAFVFYYFTSKLVTTEKKLRQVLVVFLCCQTLRVLEPLYLHVTIGYWGSKAHTSAWEAFDRLSGAPSDTVNPNGLAAIALTVIPLLHYLTAGKVLGRLLYISVLPMLLWALVLTASRSGMVGLAGIFGLVWLKSRHKILLAAVVATAVVLVTPHLSADLSDRYLSLVKKDTKNAVTANERYDGMWINLQVAMKRPLFGYGLGTSEEANWNFGGLDLPAHNLYLEVAQELGFIGLAMFVTFVCLLLGGLRAAAAALKRSKAPLPILLRLVPALQVFLGMNILFSLASYGLSQYDWYFTAGLTDVVTRLLVPAAAAAASTTPLPQNARMMPPLRPIPSASRL
jgi:O-antigen ligase